MKARAAIRRERKPGCLGRLNALGLRRSRQGYTGEGDRCGEGEDEDRTDHVRYIPGSGASHKGSCVGASRGHT